MSVKSTHFNEHCFHFVTFTCFQWLNLFEVANAYREVYNWFHYLNREKSIKVVSYVIMSNHVHVILYLPSPATKLNTIISNGKRFLAYAIIKALEELGRHDILDLLYDSVTRKERNKGQRHRVFEKSFDAKPIYTSRFLYQKLDYIHFNPVRGKWHLASEYTLYCHSSASFYEMGKSQYFEPVHYDDV